MLDDDDRVSVVDQAVEHAQQLAHVLEVEPGGRFVEYVDGVSGGTLGQFAGQLHPLGLPSRQGGRRLPEAHIAQPDVDQGLHVPGDGRLVLEEAERLVARHVQDVGDRPALEAHVQGVPVVALSLADLACDVDVGQEVHLDADGAVARAGLAPSALHVEAEPARLVAPDPGLLGPGEQLPDVVEHARVGGRVGPWRPTYGRLVDVDDLVDALGALQRPVESGWHLGAVHPLHEGLVQDLVHQGRLARSGDAGDRHEAAQRELHVDVVEVVLAGTPQQQPVAVGGTADLRYQDLLPA